MLLVLQLEVSLSTDANQCSEYSSVYSGNTSVLWFVFFWETFTINYIIIFTPMCRTEPTG